MLRNIGRSLGTSPVWTSLVATQSTAVGGGSILNSKFPPLWNGVARSASGPVTQTPPADASRAGTADLCDVHLPDPVDKVCERKVQIVEPIFRDFGGAIRAHGQIATVKCFENNPLVRKALEEKGNGRVLVVDGGASLRCALLGDNLAEMGYKNGWSGIIVYGCIRDSEDIGKMPILVKALNTYPLKSAKRDVGLSNVEVSFGGATFKPGHWVHADKDGILVAPEELKL
ncbi:hypothetical protein BSKO_13728 [Bryopsis sp. KO-2023]|nr:hypothetical protein BSKO_13728 [Bryopsis sp. KO-2023]